jgi:hypothetical protein
MKVTEVLAKVYEPGRLQAAWQQVKQNAGAAGIDRMTVAEFAQREDILLGVIHDKLKSGNYRFKPGCEAGWDILGFRNSNTCSVISMPGFEAG